MLKLSVKSEGRRFHLEPFLIEALISLELRSQGLVLALKGIHSLREDLLGREAIGLPVVLAHELVAVLVKADVVQLLRAS